ncbi:peptide-modifying radical SAM enzyme CbpB [Thermodesulforhabdus norvegica]|uniref:Radical SAM core domain-containing protein n=1 Tax=Thermodesulforhabdus norvegica TaxID=39841 RepID=A0A1I4RA65_9BACT|nr:peptide-modifying radical SAM enzyme CbpB [Thermodesulforhabdus norvegica]SFM49162.1 uncharacterized protein SAMN05660836_00502 [Thermodesulforhabdus norvegica]
MTIPLYANTGYGPHFSVIDIGLKDKVAVIDPDTGFWALSESSSLGDILAGDFAEKYMDQRQSFAEEMDNFRFNLTPSAVYFNPTEKCNFNCTYCYIPEEIRRNGVTMTSEEVSRALNVLKEYFGKTLPPKVKPQVIFHGSEPMIARDAVFRAIEDFRDDFLFGIQTNGILLDREAVEFLTSRNTGIGLSLDAPVEEVANTTRKNWSGQGGFRKILEVLEMLREYPAYNVITTVTRENVHLLPQMVDFFADLGVQMVMFNPVRCTQRGGRELKPEDSIMAEYFCRALDQTRTVRDRKGFKIVVVNFANVLAGILGPTTRRLMCDISPCGGGRCFFAVSARGDLFPCSEFVGFPEFRGGNLLKDPVENALKSEPFLKVTNRKVEDIAPCFRCAIKHFCGAPCPAEVYSLHGKLNAPAPYCKFYEEQVRYAFRVIASGEEKEFLWDGWEEETEETFSQILP